MRILYITTISGTMNAFFGPHIEMLVREGHYVDIACDFKEWGMDDIFKQLGCDSYQIDFSRKPLALDNFKAYGQLKKVIENGNYDIVHCHTPNAAVITRLVCRKFRKKHGLKVFYTAHGFHFYKGAPKLNWLVFYPVEKFCSYFTDKLITINVEDYELAKNKFHAREVHYVPGVGIDLSRFENVQVDRNVKRREIGVPEDAFLLISVGELSKRKNHSLVLQAMTQMSNSDIHYAIVGKGSLQHDLQNYAKEHGLSDNVHLLGYRKDIAQLYKASDLCCFPSIHEGLPVALMEAMACGLPVVCSRIRGNSDLISENGGALFDPYCADDCQQAIVRVMNGDRSQMGRANQKYVNNYSTDQVLVKLKSTYES